MTWLSSPLGGILHLESYLTIVAVRVNDPSKPTVVGGNGQGLEPGVLMAIAPSGLQTKIAEGWMSEMSALQEWVAKQVGRATLIKVADFLGSEEAKAPPRIVLPKPSDGSPG